MKNFSLLHCNDFICAKEITSKCFLRCKFIVLKSTMPSDGWREPEKSNCRGTSIEIYAKKSRKAKNHFKDNFASANSMERGRNFLIVLISPLLTLDVKVETVGKLFRNEILIHLRNESKQLTNCVAESDSETWHWNLSSVDVTGKVLEDGNRYNFNDFQHPEWSQTESISR